MDGGGAISVSAAGVDELAELAALRTSWTADMLGPRPDDGFPEALEDWVRSEVPRRRFWIARAGDEPVGMVNLLVIDRMPAPGWHRPSWGYLNNMYVRAEFRKRGVGAALVEAVLTHAGDQELQAILLNPSEMAVSLYERHGFVRNAGLMAWVPDAAVT